MSATKKENTLTIKQENFCQEYIKHGNASLAYRLSYDCSKSKDNSIWNSACLLLQNPKVAQRIKELRLLDSEKFAAEKNNAVKVLCDIIGMSVDDLFYIDPATGKNKLRLPNELPTRTKNCIQEIDNDKGKVKYKMYSKIEAIRQLSNLLGWDEAKQIDVKSEGKNILRIGFNDE